MRPADSNPATQIYDCSYHPFEASSSVPMTSVDLNSVGNGSMSSLFKDVFKKPDGALFHCMLSYRVSTDSVLVRSIHDGLHMKCLNAKQQGTFPEFFEAAKYPSPFDRADQAKQSNLNIFLDQFCLQAGQDWADSGFLLALSQSLVFIPILSWNSDSSSGDSSGSIGGLACHGKSSGVDNVLLELVIAKELHRVWLVLSKDVLQSQGLLFPCMIILPIFTSNFFSKISTLSDDVPLSTLQRASEALIQFGVTPGSGFLQQTVREIVHFYSSLQCLRYFDWGATVSANQQAVKGIWRILKNLASVFDFESFQMNQFKHNQPHGSELVTFLAEKDAGYLARVFVKHGIYSVARIARLIDEEQSVGIIARETAQICQRPVLEEILNVKSVALLASTSGLALPLRVQLRDCVDKDASVLTAIYSSSGMDIMLSKPVFQLLMLFIGALAIAIGVNSFNQNGWLGNAIVLLWTGKCMFMGSTIAYFKAPRLGRYIYCLLFCGDTVIFVALFIANIVINRGLLSDSDHSSMLTRDEALASFARLYRDFSLFMVYAPMSYAMVFRQRVFWCCFCLSMTHLGTTLMLINAFVFRSPGTINWVINAFIAAGTLALLAITELCAQNGRNRARKLVVRDRFFREGLWVQQMSASTIFVELVSFLEASSFSPVVERLSSRNNDLVSIEVLQNESNIDALYRNGVVINFFFQDWIKSWFEDGTRLEASNPRLNFKDVFDIHIPNVKANVLRGPIKQPTRAIAKVG